MLKRSTKILGILMAFSMVFLSFGPLAVPIMAADTIRTPFYLSFPLTGFSAYSVTINSIFDHSMTTPYYDDNLTEAYTGEFGKFDNINTNRYPSATTTIHQGHPLFGLKNPDNPEYVFSLNGQYSKFGAGKYLFYDGHPGYDFQTGRATVKAAADGWAYLFDDVHGGIRIVHAGNYETSYLHLGYDPNRDDVKADPNNIKYADVTNRFVGTNTKGDFPNPTGKTEARWVKRGQSIGIAGDKGALNAVHLHFEVLHDGHFVDPYGWEGTGEDPYTQLNGITNEHLWDPIVTGIHWLRLQQKPDGSWSEDPALTSFAVLTMLSWDYPESDEIISKGISYIVSNINSGSVRNSTYYTAIAILPLAATTKGNFTEVLDGMRQWLINIQWDENQPNGGIGPENSNYGGFGYGDGTRPDLSNTQWALMGLKAADRKLGKTATVTYNHAAENFLKKCHNPDGGSAYTPGEASIHTMTAASVWSFALCNHTEDEEFQEGIQWLTGRYNLTNVDGWNYWAEYYYKVTLAKALMISGHNEKLGEHKWTEELTTQLVKEQYDSGYWPNTGMMNSELSTGWAVMALQTYTLPPGNKYRVWAELKSHCDLHIYDPSGNHTGVNYATGVIEENIPGSNFRILNSDGNEVPYSGNTPEEGYRQEITLTALESGSYRFELIGTSEGPFEFTVIGLNEDEQVDTHTFQGNISPGERLATNITVTSMEGPLTLLYDPLTEMPVSDVVPEHIEVIATPDSTVEVNFVVNEIGNKETLHGVTPYCTDIVGNQGLIDGDNVTFDVNNFDIPPGGSQAIKATISVPVDFVGPGAGSIIIESTDGGTKSIELSLLSNSTGPDIGVTITDNPDPVILGRDLTYVISVTNNGPMDAFGVNLNTDLPDGMELKSANTHGNGAYKSGSWDIGNLPVGWTVTLTLVFATIPPTQPGKIVISADLASIQTDPNMINNSATQNTQIVATLVPGITWWGSIGLMLILVACICWMIQRRRARSKIN
jgi:squalene-hopene/tetraprenyl-beta-curcumene cyclase